VGENCALLGYYAANSDNFLPTFRYDLSDSSSSVKNPRRKPAVQIMCLCSEERGRGSGLSSVVSANRADASSWVIAGVWWSVQV